MFKIDNVFVPFTDTEGFVIYLMLRRKWLVKNYPDKREYFEEIFKSNENIIAKTALTGNTDNFLPKIKLLKYNLNIRKQKTLRTGDIITIDDLYKKYPLGFSIVFTYEPKDLIKAGKNYTSQLFNMLIDCDIEKNKWIFTNLDKEWYRNIHRKSRRTNGQKYLLLDFDLYCDNYSKTISKYTVLVKFLKKIKLYNNVTYAVTTPSFGLHIVLKIDGMLQNIFFKNRRKFLEDIKNVVGAEPDVLVRDFMTHIPFLNENVKYIL